MMKKVLLMAVLGLAMAGCSKNSTTSQGGAAGRDQSSANSEDLKQLEDTRVGPNATGLFGGDSNSSSHSAMPGPGASNTNSQPTNAAAETAGKAE